MTTSPQPLTREQAHRGDPCMYCQIPHDQVAIGPCSKRTAYEIADALLIQSGLYQRAAVWPVEPSFRKAIDEVAVHIATHDAALRARVEELTYTPELKTVVTKQVLMLQQQLAAVEREVEVEKLQHRQWRNLCELGNDQYKLLEEERNRICSRKFEEVNKLRRTIEAREETIAAVEKEWNGWKIEFERKRDDAATWKAEHDDLKNTLKQRDAFVKEQRFRIDELEQRQRDMAIDCQSMMEDLDNALAKVTRLMGALKDTVDVLDGHTTGNSMYVDTIISKAQLALREGEQG